MRARRYALIYIAAAISMAATCAGPSEVDITRERAIAIARPQVSFEPDTIDAERATSSTGRAVWRVTFRGRLPGQPPGLFEIRIVEVDRRSGEIVSVARS